MQGRLEGIEVLGADAIAHVRIGRHLVRLRVDRSLEVPIGSDVGVTYDDAAVHHFDTDD